MRPQRFPHQQPAQIADETREFSAPPQHLGQHVLLLSLWLDTSGVQDWDSVEGLVPACRTSFLWPEVRICRAESKFVNLNCDCQGGLLSFPRTGCALRASPILSQVSAPPSIRSRRHPERSRFSGGVRDLRCTRYALQKKGAGRVPAPYEKRLARCGQARFLQKLVR